MTRIKICGLFRDCDIDYVNEAAPDYIGFVFAESRRRISAEKAAEMRKRLAPSIIPVGVFADAPQDEVIRLFREGVIEIAQLHGNEDEDYIRKLKQGCGVPVIKAMQVKKSGDIESFKNASADYLLLDSGAGGTGKTFDWTLIAGMEKPFFLAGGVNLENLDAALKLSPCAVDISSGAETDGVKDREKILRLVHRVRGIKNGIYT